MILKINNFQAWRITHRVLIGKLAYRLIIATLLSAAGFMAYMAVMTYIEMHDDRERAVHAQAEAFELLNGRIFIADGEKFRLATEPLPKLIGE